MPGKVVAHLLAADGAIPNHPRWPLLVYPAALALSGPDPAALFEELGGDAGVKVVARPGDVIVLPAGTGHKKLSSRGDLGVVGAYPDGARPDTCMPPLKNNAVAVAKVPLPPGDPVFGESGPLFQHWRG